MLVVFLAYGAPVLLSGEATFAGYLRLDDTASWLALVDQVLSHGRSLADVAPSTHRELLASALPKRLPARRLHGARCREPSEGLDPAWGFAPYLSFCGAALAAAMYGLIDALAISTRLRAVVVAAAAQPALLYSYVQWGGIKEITVAAALLVLVALATPHLERAAQPVRALLPLGVVSASLIALVGPGGVGFVGPTILVVAGSWLWRAPVEDRYVVGVRVATLAGVIALCALPTFLSLASTLAYTTLFFDSAKDRRDALRQPSRRAAGAGSSAASGWSATSVSYRRPCRRSRCSSPSRSPPPTASANPCCAVRSGCPSTSEWRWPRFWRPCWPAGARG